MRKIAHICNIAGICNTCICNVTLPTPIDQKLTLITTAVNKKIADKNYTVLSLCPSILIPYIDEFRVFIDQEKPHVVSLDETKFDQSICISYVSYTECLIASLESENKKSIIMGDTNCDFLNPSNNNTKNLKRISNSFELTQLIKEPTRTTATTKTIIDHIITNKPNMVSNSGVISCGISDRDVVFIERNVRAPKLKVRPKISNVRNFKRFDSVSFQADIKGIPWRRSGQYLRM